MDSKEMRKYVVDCLSKITGQQPILTKTRKAISNFKTREGMVVGSVVTLRGQQMEKFLDRLVSYALPRIRDFRGLPTKLDGNGNYAIGIRDHSIFPEVPLPDANQIFGLQVQITTTANDDEQAFALLKEIGIPFRPEKKKEDDDEKKQQEAQEAKAAAEAAAKEEIAPDTEESEPAASGDDSENKKDPKEGEKKDDTPVDESSEKPDTHVT
jgi:large subunit ribosomal protein L5